ncbi:MAG: ATP phosphoribosyltransferase [Firmicutes bacterium]|nr:ATP phosphoribosyltransferase [Bacillota bacterium]
MEKLKLALTKGRLEEKTIEIFEKAGINIAPFKIRGRKLITYLPDCNLEVVFAKANDVVTYVEHGVCDIGIAGKDTLLEMDRPVFEMIDLGFGKCRFALAAKEGEDFYGGFNRKVIATKYPNFSKEYFSQKNIDVEIVKIEGSVELAPLLKLSDAIVDLVETGTTLKENGLTVLEDICNISARLIVNMVSLKMKKKSIESFIDRIKSVL